MNKYNILQSADCTTVSEVAAIYVHQKKSQSMMNIELAAGQNFGT